MYEYQTIERKHIAGIVDLCRIEGYESYTEDEEKTWRALASPGSVNAVALAEGTVVGFVHVMSDGEIQAHLSMILVAGEHRRKGIGKRLIEIAYSKCNAKWINLLSERKVPGFYASFKHNEFRGFRIYPDAE